MKSWISLLAVIVILAAVPLPAFGQASEDIRNAGAEKVVPGSANPGPVWQRPTAILFDNGPLVTHASGGAGGADASRLQNSTLLMTTFGVTASTATVLRIADDFTVPAGPGWNISSITFFGYQTGSTTTSTMNDVRLQVWSGAPNAGGIVVFGNTTTNRLASTSFSNIYRDSQTSVANNQRPIMAVTATVNTTLAPGTYWVDFQLGGTLVSGPFTPPVTVTGSNSPCTPCNALQWNGTTWAAVIDNGSATAQDVKFVIDGATAPVELQHFVVD